MEGGGGDGRKPAASSCPSSRRQKPGISREFGPERSLESQKEGTCSSSPSVSSKNSLLQMVTPVLPKSLDSPVQPPKSLDSPLQAIKQVQLPKFQDSLVQMFASIQESKPLDSSSASCGSGTVRSDLGAALFDICMGNSKGFFKLSRPLHEINKEKRLRAKELSNSAAPLQHLRPGMVLLKNFLKPDDQVKIIKLCRELGVGTGGFYQPGYRDGGKSSLQMMCFGKNWNPDSSSYGDIRPFDGAQPPQMPQELTKFVRDAIEASHEFLKGISGRTSNPSFELPFMSPDICIVNFYTITGKLGLHQDRDETIDSLSRRLPVVSFSLGDAAEFLYGDVRDEAKASKIKLESGDVLIFGGPSRHIFHGVSSITPKTAPAWLTDEANLRPGRLNLTFRQYNGSANLTHAPNLRPRCLNLTSRQYKELLNVTPDPFDTCVCEKDAAPLQHLRPGMVLLKSPQQMVTPGQPKSLDSPVRPPKSLDTLLQTVKQVQQPKSLDSLVQMVESMQLPKSPESKSASSGSGAAGSDLGAAPFDICMGNSKRTVILKHGLLEINREKRRARELSNIAPMQHLRPGMVLLKNFLKPDDQVKIIKDCRDLGVGPGGFYQPGYREGAKLTLRMMCLGKNWDPDSGKYGDIRPFDTAQPPKIPEELTKYVKDSIAASHEFLKQRGEGASNPVVELPVMSPDICIVNFYTTSGKLGFHQDNNEQESSLAKGLPVVSFSLGDTAEFLYGDVRDDDKASKIKLESGDVLIFGGQSRHIFHGVSSIAPKSAPLWVTDKADLRPGRLNLTFRQYNYNGQYKESLNVTPASFDTCVCDKDAAPLQHLRPGMVLLKKFLKANDQVKIFKLCHKLGINARGSLCLGKKCNQYSNSYGDMRPFDGAQPDIPIIFKTLVEEATETSHEFLERRGGTSNPLLELPPMSPDMCTVGFDIIIPTIVVRQDTDVTEASLARELPVVSFWLGDTAEFLYRGIRDDVASKIDLESGDVLIFGGQSRRISHAVSSIKPRTAPEWLPDKMNLQAGLLNLTFRQLACLEIERQH